MVMVSAHVNLSADLQAALNQLARVRRRFGDDLFMQAVEHTRSASLAQAEAAPVNNFSLWQEVAVGLCGVSVDELRTLTRRLPVVRARALVIISADRYLVAPGQEEAGKRLSTDQEIARLFCRPPSYVRQLRSSIARWQEGDPEFFRLVSRMRAKLDHARV